MYFSPLIHFVCFSVLDWTLPTVNQHSISLIFCMDYGLWMSFVAPLQLLTIPGKRDPPFCRSSY